MERRKLPKVTCTDSQSCAAAGKLLPESSYNPPAMEEGENPDQSQFPFEATAAPPQDPARASQAAGTEAAADSALLQVLRVCSPTL